MMEKRCTGAMYNEKIHSKTLEWIFRYDSLASSTN